jgi:hypothetical protein
VRRLLDKSLLKYSGLTREQDAILSGLRIDRDAGTARVAVKCVDISWNTKGEGKHLGFSLTLRHES